MRKWRRRAEPRRDQPQGTSGILATSRADKGGVTHKGGGGRNRPVAQGFRGQEGPGDQVKDNNTASAGRVVEAEGSGLLSRWTGNPRL